jgi:methyl-accepting chemotaxis protein
MIGFSFRLTHKVMAIALIGLLSLVAFGTIYFVGRSSQDASRTAAANIRNIADLNQKLAIDMLQARRAEMEFQLRHDQSYAQRHAEISADVSRDIERLRGVTLSGGFSAMVDKVDAVAKGYSNYDKEFTAIEQAELRLGLNETLGLSGSLRGAVHDIEAKLKEANDPKLTSGMLMMRRHEKDFMLRRDQKYIGELTKTATEFAKTVADAELPGAAFPGRSAPW